MLLRYWIGNLQINPIEYFEVFQPLKLQGWKLSLKNSQISWFVGLLTSQEVSSSFKECSFVCNYWHNISIAQHCVYLKEFSFLTWFFILFQEAARLQREQTWTPATMSPAPGSSSSRESSLDPASCVVHTASASVLSTRCPRQIIIQRSDDGFGFTLRHFIVYPPDVRQFLAAGPIPVSSRSRFYHLVS